MQHLLDAIKNYAGMLDRTVGQPRFGTVSSFNAADNTARVLLQPEGTVTGWLPVLSPWTGAGWGIVCPLAAGDQALVLPQEGDAEHGVIIGRAYSSRCPPPQAPSGEFWIVHPAGSCLKLRNDGTISIIGDVRVEGDVYDRHGSLAHLRQVFNAHIHLGTSGTRTSSPINTD